MGSTPPLNSYSCGIDSGLADVPLAPRRPPSAFRKLVLLGSLLALVGCGSGKIGAQVPGDGDGDGDHNGDGDHTGGDGDHNGGDGDHTGGDGDHTGGDGDHTGGDGDTVDPDPNAKITLPMVVDDFYYASGYAGDGAMAGHVTEVQSCPERGGEKRGACHAYTWTPTDNGWATVFWQFPPNNWGKEGIPGRAIPAGAKKISFYAWGAKGGESVSFGAGLSMVDSFEMKSPPFTLTKEPKQYSLSLADVNYGDKVISAFMWSTQPAGKDAVTFYVDDIVWEGTADTKPTPDWPDGPGANGVSLRVRNLCPFPLWIGGDAKQGSLDPSRVQLNTGDIHNYDAPKTWETGRVNAFANSGDAEPREKVEMTFYENDAGNHVGYNVTYVDWLGLPMEITSRGGDCNEASDTVTCPMKAADVVSGCPESFLKDNDRCISPRSYCLNGHDDNPYCHALDSAISSCSGCPQGSTAEVYACSGPYGGDPTHCAALNRGMTSDPDNPDEGLYYQNPPYNTYAKWVHQVCPGIYSFSYDDVHSHGGYRECAGGTEVRITFCPNG
jgi:hypothetical protein